MKTLSVACGDSSPKGRAKGLLQTRQIGTHPMPSPYAHFPIMGKGRGLRLSPFDNCF